MGSAPGRLVEARPGPLRGRPSTAFLLRQLGVLCSFETTLVLFLFAGVYKEDPRFSWIPGDITLLAFGLSVVCGFYLLVRRGVVLRRQNVIQLCLVLLFMLWALLSYLWTPSISYSVRKIGTMCSLTLWPTAAFALIVCTERERLRRFFVVLLCFSLWVASETGLSLLMAYRTGLRGFIKTSLSANYLGLGRVIGPGMLVLLSWYIYFLRGRWQRFIGGGLIVLYAFLMLGLGSRGPFLAMLAGCFWIAIVNLRPAVNIRQITGQFLAVAAAASLCVGIVFYFVTTGAELPRTLQRLQEIKDSSIEENSRVQLYTLTWQMIDDAPLFGHGIGSWPVLTGRGDIRAYPHNVFLEIFFELGIVGLLLFGFILLHSWRLVPARHVLRNEPWMMLASAQLLSAFLNANLSGDMNDNKLFWAFLGLVTVCSLQPQLSARPEPQSARADGRLQASSSP